MRYAGPKCRLCRSSGVKLFLKGEKCEAPKCPVVRRQSAPGQHTKTRFKISDFAYHLKEKQKLKKIYLISEAQLKKYFEKSRKHLGNTGEMLLSLLERRFDNVLVRAGLGASQAQSRQLIRHNHFKVNGKAVNIPSFILKIGDKVTFEKERSLLEVNRPSWVAVDANKRILEIIGLPKREEIEDEINEQLVVEFYSR